MNKGWGKCSQKFSIKFWRNLKNNIWQCMFNCISLLPQKGQMSGNF